MSFIIEINGKDITTIEEVRENFDIDVLLSHKDNFDVWLAGWDYEDEAAQVRDLPPNLSDDDWLKKVCKIIGIPSATLTAAKRKRTSDAKKAEKAKAAEEEMKKESEAKKKVAKKKAGEIDFNKLRINIEKYPDLGLPSFVCDKGAIFRSDDNLVFIDANADIHTTKDSPFDKRMDCIEQINGFFIILHRFGGGISFSEDGIHWQTQDAENFRKYELGECFDDVELHGIVFDGKQYVILCSQNYRYEEGGWFSEEKWRRDYHIAKADSLSDKWECQDAYYINGHDCYNFFFQNNKFFVEITDYNDNSDWTKQAVYYSDDSINWTEADSSDREWLEDLTLSTNDRISFSIFWWEERWGFGIRKIIRDDPVYKNKIIFKFEANKVLAALVLDKDKEEYSEFKVVAECDFTLDSIFLCNDKLLLCNEKFSLFDSNPEKHLAIGKITFD